MSDWATSSGGSPEEALVSAFNEARNELVSTLYFMLGNYEDALDATQETFLKCWRAADQNRDVQNYRAWIFRVGMNAAKDLQRNAWRRKSRPLSAAASREGQDGVTPAEQAAANETRDRVRKALQELRPEEREVYLLREGGDLTYEEIAELRKTPVGTIKTQMRSAIHKLRALLQEKK